MDLTREYPRSVSDKWQGVVQLGRAIDKGKAEAQGKVGEYHYNCPMDQAVFGFLGVNHDRLLDVIRKAKSDADIEAFTRPFVDAKSREEIERWNRDWLAHEPEGPSRDAFLELRSKIAPQRTDVTTWPDLLDLDDVLTRFAAEEPDKARLVQLRFFAGLSTPDAAAALGISVATAERWWTFARTWLYSELHGEQKISADP